jgi:hypothetical protein
MACSTAILTLQEFLHLLLRARNSSFCTTVDLSRAILTTNTERFTNSTDEAIHSGCGVYFDKVKKEVTTTAGTLGH